MIYGVDLGTSNCLIAKLETDKHGTRVRCLADQTGNVSFPSVVHFIGENDVLIGQPAKDKLDEYPDETIEFVKVRLGREIEIPYYVDGYQKGMEPQTITALFLKHLQKVHAEGIKDVILTVPAYFGDAQRSATKQAGELADINVLELIDEPSAAIMYYFYKLYHKGACDSINHFKDKNYLVFDFGGGTLDLSLIKIEIDEEIHIKTSVLLKGGSNDTGGKDIDFRFTQFLLETLKELYPRDEFLNTAEEVFKYYSTNYRFPQKTPQAVKLFLISLKQRIEQCKIQLSSSQGSLLKFPHAHFYESETITRKEFEDNVLKQFFKKPIIGVLSRIRNQAHNHHYSVDEIILIGGSAKIPYVQRIIRSVFRDQPIESLEDQELAVSKGAAIIGAIKAGQYVEPFGRNRCHNCVAHDLHIGQKGGQSVKLVSCGTPIPFDPVHETFTIRHALRTNIEIELKEIYLEESLGGSDEPVIHEEVIKRIKFYHPFFYTNEEIEVILTVDESGIWRIQVIHKETNEALYFEAEKNTLLSSEACSKAKRRLERITEG